jgi:hypothetical protein
MTHPTISVNYEHVIIIIKFWADNGYYQMVMSCPSELLTGVHLS